MILFEFEIKRCKKLVAEFIERRRQPARLRQDIDLAFRGQGYPPEQNAPRTFLFGDAFDPDQF
jgi:hypothetical protein